MARGQNYQTLTLENFGGLDLRRDPQDASPIRAVDMLNVDLFEDGRIRRRPGITKIAFQSSEAAISSVL